MENQNNQQLVISKKIMVAMSGGIDSTFAALLLKQTGYDIAGITMFFRFPSN